MTLTVSPACCGMFQLEIVAGMTFARRWGARTYKGNEEYDSVFEDQSIERQGPGSWVRFWLQG